MNTLPQPIPSVHDGALLLYRVPLGWRGEQLNTLPPRGCELVGTYEIPSIVVQACRDRINQRFEGRVWCVAAMFV